MMSIPTRRQRSRAALVLDLCAALVLVSPVDSFRAAVTELRGHPAVDTFRPRSGGGRPLTDNQLRGIYSIDCLRTKQLHGPLAPCDHGLVANEETDIPPLGIGTYPNWQETICRSHGEFFCDPEVTIPESQVLDVVKSLNYVKQTARVTCGQLESKLSFSDKTHTRPFNFGVAIADNWPQSEKDPMSLQKFGLLLMTDWGLMPMYNGVDQGNGVNEAFAWKDYAANCPNAAVLIVLPKYGTAFLSSPSCEFICEDRGGPEVVNAVVERLNRDGNVGMAVQAGIEEVGRIIRETDAASLVEAEEPSYRTQNRMATWEAKLLRQEDTWNFLLRLVFVLVIVIAFAGVGVAALWLFGPFGSKDDTREGRKSHVLHRILFGN